MIGPAIRSHFASVSAINSALAGRVYPGRIPQDPTFPAARYTILADVNDQHHGGVTKLRVATVRLEVFAASYVAAVDLQKAIKDAIGGLSGTLGSSPNSVTCQAIFVRGETDAFEDDLDASDDPQGIFGRSADYEIWYLEP